MQLSFILPLLIVPCLLVGCSSQQTASSPDAESQGRQRRALDKSIPPVAQGRTSQMLAQKVQQDAMRAQDAAKK